MSKKDMNELVELGRASSPEMIVYTSAVTLPSGEYGYCIASMTEKYFYITDCVGYAMKLGDLMYKIPIEEMENLKHSPRIRLTQTFEFTWKGELFKIGPLTPAMKKALGIESKLI